MHYKIICTKRELNVRGFYYFINNFNSQCASHFLETTTKNFRVQFNAKQTANRKQVTYSVTCIPSMLCVVIVYLTKNTKLKVNKQLITFCFLIFVLFFLFIHFHSNIVRASAVVESTDI